MMRQGEELLSFVDIDIREEDKKAANKYMHKMYGILAVFFVPFALIYLYGTINLFISSMSWHMSSYVIDVMYLWFFVFIVLNRYNKIKFVNKMRGILQSECDPEHMLSWCAALMKYLRKNKAWGEYFYNIGCSLYYAGRIEDAKKVVGLMDKYLTVNRDLYLRSLWNSHIHFYEKNQEELQKDCEDLMNLSKKVRLNKQMKFFLKATLSQIAFLNLEQQGRYEELYEMYKASYSYYQSKLVEVMKNYYMYQAAKGMGKNDIAAFHRQTVLNNGGTLWYKADIENECR